jgi:coproporphyrinogen III oxidase-like Fe-S oxidoreductase
MVAGNDPDRTLEERFNTFKVVEFTIGTDPEKLEDARVIYNLRQMSMTRVSVKDSR